MVYGTKAKKITALIAGGEHESRENLYRLLSLYCPEIDVIGDTFSIHEAERMLDHLKPMVTFKDICTPGGDEVEFVRQWKDRTRVILISAYRKYALPALKAGVVDYLLKPLNKDDLRTAVNKLSHLPGNDTNIVHQKRRHDRIALPTQRGLEIMPIREISYIESANSYSTVHSTNKKVLVCKGIGDFENLLDGEQFFRIHNSYLVNLDYVHLFKSEDGVKLQLNDGTLLPVAKRRYKYLRKAFLS